MQKIDDEMRAKLEAFLLHAEQAELVTMLEAICAERPELADALKKTWGITKGDS